MMKKMHFIYVIMAVSFVFPLQATRIFQEGSLKLHDVLAACPEVRDIKPQASVFTELIGGICTIKNIKYEWRYFSFYVNPDDILATQKFEEYVKNKNLENLPSLSSSPHPDLKFESFDFRRAQLHDGVYFSMALRHMDLQKK